MIDRIFETIKLVFAGVLILGILGFAGLILDLSTGGAFGSPAYKHFDSAGRISHQEESSI